jgi:hypothetical protein
VTVELLALAPSCLDRARLRGRAGRCHRGRPRCPARTACGHGCAGRSRGTFGQSAGSRTRGATGACLRTFFPALTDRSVTTARGRIASDCQCGGRRPMLVTDRSVSHG